MMCSEQSRVDDGQLLCVYLQTMYNMFCLLLKIPVERNNIMTKYSVKKSGF